MGGTAVTVQLTNEDKGVWRVTTEASAYIIDLDNKRAKRLPGEGAGATPLHDRVVVVNFPHDGLWLEDVNVLNCRRGERMALTHIPSHDLEWVRSTVVRSIIPMVVPPTLNE
jgi:hypothetical protein